MALLVLVAGCSGGNSAQPVKPHDVHRRGNCPPERTDGAYDLDGEQASARRGTTDKTFADTRSSQTLPLQTCGLHGELAYLTRVTCADGSHPWSSRDGAHAARKGSAMTPGPICQRPVDVYVAPCPETTYEIHFDMYQCGPGEELFRDTGAR